MSDSALKEYYKIAKEHKMVHNCAAVPYEYGEKLTELVADKKPKYILEVGTGIGYSTACLWEGHTNATIHTIEKDIDHIVLAKEKWDEFSIVGKITLLEGKAEDIVPTLKPQYDFIFYDGYVPQKKLLIAFYDLLKLGGLLVTANLFLVHPTGGKYLERLKNEKVWTTSIFADTAISIKVA